MQEEITKTGDTARSFLEALRGKDSEFSRKAVAALERLQNETPEQRAARLAEEEKKEYEYSKVMANRVRYTSSGLTKTDIEERTIDKYIPESESEKKAKAKVARAIQDWPNTKRSLYIHSPEHIDDVSDDDEDRFGCGKTHLAIAYGLGVLAKGDSVRYWYMPDFEEEFDKSQRFDLDVQTPVIAAKDCDLLIFDDIEKAKWDPGTKLYRAVMQIINYRVKEHKAMAITANSSIKIIKEIFLGAAYDRMNVCHLIEVAGRSRRKPA
jgi:chromosomal replication initiation ATPase DnaA